MFIDRDKNKESENNERAPLKREAPLPFPTPRKRGPLKPAQGRDLGKLFKNGQLQFEQNTGFQGGPSSRRKGYRLALWSVLASFIDGLILVSLSSLFLVSFSLIVQSSFGSVFNQITHQKTGFLFFAQVFFVFAWIYSITIRNFMGSTIGEWACDLRLGQPHERLQQSYVLKVALRSTLILFTGVLPLPLLSLIIGKDLAGHLSGLKLFSLK